MLPSWPTLDLPPGAVLRRHHIDHMREVIERLRGGLRSTRTIPLSVHMQAHVGVPTFDASGGFATLPAGVELHLALPLYVGDRITHFGVSLVRAGVVGATVTLRRFKRSTPGYEAPYLHTQVSTPRVLSTRELMPAVGLQAVTIESGYVYRLCIAGGQANDVVYGGFLQVDHPRIG
jgi:hypothetical protein